MNPRIRQWRRPAARDRAQQRRGRKRGAWAAVLLFGTVTVLPAVGEPAVGEPGPAAAGSLILPWGGNRFEPPWSWPLSPAPSALRSFQAPAQRWLAGHRGVDFAAEPGVPVLSPESGTVVFAGRVVDRPVVTVDLGAGLVSSFEPVQPLKQAGERVAEGEVLGHVATPATPGHCPLSCLHWGVRLNGTYVNPLNFVTNRRPSILLPLR